MDLEELAKYAQIIKTGAIILGGSACAALGYKIMKERKRLVRNQENLSRAREGLASAQGTLAMAENLGGRPSYKDLKRFVDEEYYLHKAGLEQIQGLPERYNDGIFEVEKNVKEEGFSTHITKKTRGLVEAIEDGAKEYSAAASFVKDKEKTVSNIRIKKDNEDGVLEFPRQLSNSEKNTLVGRRVAYEEKYSCYDEGAYHGLLQSWHYNIEVLDGPQKGFKLKEDVTI